MKEESKSEMLAQLWDAYNRDKNPEWLKSMLIMNVFEHTPMPNEIAQEIFYHLNEHIYEGPKKRKNEERDDLICRLYGTLAPRHNEELNKSTMRDVAKNFSDLNEDAIRTILRRKFDPKKHIHN